MVPVRITVAIPIISAAAKTIIVVSRPGIVSRWKIVAPRKKRDDTHSICSKCSSHAGNELLKNIGLGEIKKLEDVNFIGILKINKYYKRLHYIIQFITKRSLVVGQTTNIQRLPGAEYPLCNSTVRKTTFVPITSRAYYVMTLNESQHSCRKESSPSKPPSLVVPTPGLTGILSYHGEGADRFLCRCNRAPPTSKTGRREGKFPSQNNYKRD